MSPQRLAQRWLAAAGGRRSADDPAAALLALSACALLLRLAAVDGGRRQRRCLAPVARRLRRCLDAQLVAQALRESAMPAPPPAALGAGIEHLRARAEARAARARRRLRRWMRQRGERRLRALAAALADEDCWRVESAATRAAAPARQRLWRARARLLQRVDGRSCAVYGRASLAQAVLAVLAADAPVPLSIADVPALSPLIALRRAERAARWLARRLLGSHRRSAPAATAAALWVIVEQHRGAALRAVARDASARSTPAATRVQRPPLPLRLRFGAGAASGGAAG